MPDPKLKVIIDEAVDVLHQVIDDGRVSALVARLAGQIRSDLEAYGFTREEAMLLLSQVAGSVRTTK